MLRRFDSLVLSLAGLVAFSGARQDPGGPASEPPLRARVTLGGEVVDVVLGQPGRTPDGRPIVVELLPTRAFEVADSFAFEYPREWSFIGSVGVPGPVDAWWSLHGEGALVHLRRHGREADAILDEYVGNLESTGGAPRRPVERAFGGRRLAGFAVELDVGDVRGGSRRWVQEVFAWEEAAGTSWMISVQRDATPPVPPPDPVWFDLPVGQGEEPPPRTDAVLASWRWR